MAPAGFAMGIVSTSWGPVANQPQVPHHAPWAAQRGCRPQAWQRGLGQPLAWAEDHRGAGGPVVGRQVGGALVGSRLAGVAKGAVGVSVAQGSAHTHRRENVVVGHQWHSSAPHHGAHC